MIPEPLQKDDADFMAQALKLARLACLNSHPNPAVGCLLVRHNKVIAKGYTQPAGQAHAEIMALRKAGKQARGLYSLRYIRALQSPWPYTTFVVRRLLMLV